MSDVLYVMHKDIVVAKWENKELTVINQRFLPLFLMRVSNVDLWLETRAIDSHRANSRLLKKALRIKDKTDLSVVLNVNAVMITDNYWVKSSDSNLTYADVRFSSDYFAELALRGTYDSFDKAARTCDSRTPELTNIGSFEKCWKLIDGRWHIIKQTTPQEQFSEIFIYRLGTALGMNMAKYEVWDNCVISEDFTNTSEVNFESAYSFMGDNEDYEDVFLAIKKLCPSAVCDYVNMIFLDTLCANPDRHTNNFGFLRNAADGRILGLAPCFDHNMALISRGKPKMPTDNDFLISLFCDFIEENHYLKKYIPKIQRDFVKHIADDISIDIDKEYVTDYIMARFEIICRKLSLY